MEYTESTYTLTEDERKDILRCMDDAIASVDSVRVFLTTESVVAESPTGSDCDANDDYPGPSGTTRCTCGLTYTQGHKFDGSSCGFYP